MHPQLETIFDEAENRYLKPEELSLLGEYVDSLPERLEAYRNLRDRELKIMQSVADQLQLELPQQKVEMLERSIKNALLLLRYCAMGMLLNDETFVKERLLGWLSQTIQVYDTRSIDAVLYRLLNQRLKQALNPRHLTLLSPMLLLAQNTLQQPANTPTPNR
ncbi:hypothetical protein H6F88_10015 [Oculatella sp. FACHB-28]|uniref:hypothetical protein n=1 Tax=Oculatella sp. FACHB-28 TaxID=2692845 RepID=UPI001688AF52|nr:hypothetical protein [Oculatella sp. FACHB-28]MBD2056351.1 hypothetical protein [Oculatella sp. FACHB-28]